MSVPANRPKRRPSAPSGYGPPTLQRLRTGGFEFGVLRSPGPPGVADSPVFVIVHGLGTSHRYAAFLHRALAGAGVTYSLDLPGFGGMDTPGRGLAVEDYATLVSSVLRSVLDRDRASRCVVIGHSMGAQIATELAARHPQLVSHLVLLGPVTNHLRRSARAQAVDLWRDTLKEPLAANLLVLGDYARCGPRWYTTELTAMLAYATDEHIASVAASVLVLRGSDDTVSRRAWCARLVERSRLGILEEIAGHRHLVHYSAADDVAARIRRFVRTTRAT